MISRRDSWINHMIFLLLWKTPFPLQFGHRMFLGLAPIVLFDFNQVDL